MSWQAFRVPFAAAFQTSRATLRVREGILVRIEDEHGNVGWGEASPLSDFEGGDLEEVRLAVPAMAVELPGREARELWRAAALCADVSEASARVARAGFETAIADLCARGEGMPLWAWLAGASLAEPRIPANAIVDAPGMDDVAEAVRSATAAGFRAVKLKVGHGAAADMARIAAAREAGGDALEIRLDANGGWSEEDAYEILSQCQELGVALCEQPLDQQREDVLEATARLRDRVGVPIWLDESCRSMGAVERIAATGAGEGIVVKPILTGLREAVAMLRRAEELGLKALITTTFDTGIGTAMAVHLAGLLPEPRPACGLATLGRLEHPLVAGGHYAESGCVRPGPGPGLGVEVQEQALGTYGGESGVAL